MTILSIPNKLELEIKKLAEAEQCTVNDMMIKLIEEALLLHKQQADDNEALLIHEQLMNQYADAFDKLAQ